MENDENNSRRPPSWKVEDDIRDRVMGKMQGRFERKMHRRMRNRHGVSGLAPGAIILAVGVIFLLDSLGYVRARHFLQFWPMILIFIGISKLFFDRRDTRIWGIFILLFGIFLQLSELGIGHFTWSQFWPLLLIAAGGLAMWSAIQARRLAPETVGDNSDPRNTLNENVVFSGLEKRLNSREFRGGRLQAIFGGIELDLRDAEIADSEAVLHVNAIFGGIEIRVPETWFIAARGQGIFGGFSDSTRFSPPADPDRPQKTLVIYGSSLFGGVEIRN